MAGGKRTAADLGAWLIFEDESGQGLRPPKGRTWGRRGRTPVVKVTGGHNSRVSLAALICVKPGCAPADLPRAPPPCPQPGPAQGVHRGRLRPAARCRAPAARRPAGSHLGQPECPRQPRDGRADRRPGRADRLSASALCPRAQPGRASLVAPQEIPGQPGQAQHHRADRPGQDPAQADAVPDRPPRWFPRRHPSGPHTVL